MQVPEETRRKKRIRRMTRKTPLPPSNLCASSEDTSLSFSPAGKSVDKVVRSSFFKGETHGKLSLSLFLLP
jgi:hypothetical protein